MKTKVEQLDEKNTVLLNVEISEDKFSNAINKAYKDLAGKLTIPGFRKGKIPSSIIDQRIGREAVLEEAVHQALPGFYVEAIRDADLQPVDQPDVDISQLEEGKPFIFTAKVKVKPEVKLGKYKSIKIERDSDAPTEEEINAQIDKLRENFSNLEPVEGRAVKSGDFALIDFEGFLNDVAFEGGAANDYLLEIGSGTFIPGFEDQIIGMQKGETKDVIVTFPEDYGSAELAGKDAKFKVALKEIKEKKLPEVDDEFAKQVGFESVAQLREDIDSKVSEVKKKYADAKVRSDLVDKVTSASEIDVHDIMVEHELDDMVEDYSSELVRQGFAQMPQAQGIDMVPEELRLSGPQRVALNNYLVMAGTTLETVREQWHERAESAVKSRLVLEAIAKAEGIEVADGEVEAELKKTAESMNRSYDEVKHVFEQRGTIEILRQRMMVDKTIDWLKNSANVAGETKDKKELKKEIENEIKTDDTEKENEE